MSASAISCALCKSNDTERPSNFFCYTCDYGMCVPCERKLMGTCGMCHTKVYEILNPKKVQNFKNLVNVGVQTEPVEIYADVDPDEIMECTDIVLNRRFWEQHLGHEINFLGQVATRKERATLMDSIKNIVQLPSASTLFSGNQDNG